MLTGLQDFRPVPTCEIPPPVVEREAHTGNAAETLPRVLLQSAGVETHSRRIALITLVFILVTSLEAVLLSRVGPRPLVVYRDPTVQLLVEKNP